MVPILSPLCGVTKSRIRDSAETEPGQKKKYVATKKSKTSKMAEGQHAGD